MSSTREYERCPRRYRFGYLDRRPEDRPAPPSWRFGSVVHAGLEAAYRLAMEDPTRPRSHLLAAAANGVRDAWDHYAMADDRDDLDHAIWLTTRALVKDALTITEARIVGVECVFRDTSDPRTRVAGIADLVLVRGYGTVELVDHKVTSHRLTPAELREDFQLNLYAELARRRWPHVRAIVATHHYPTGPAKVSVELAPEFMAGAYARVQAAAALIGRDTTFEASASESCRHCPWMPSCPEGTAYVAAAARPSHA